MKQKTWDNPNKMHIETGHKTFDRQTNVISTGNVIANTQFSGYIRSYFDDGEGLIDYPQNKRQPGELQKFDLKKFYDFHLPVQIISIIINQLVYNKGILYVFFHYNGKQRIIHGIILTTENYHTLYRWASYGNKNWDIISECEKYITE